MDAKGRPSSAGAPEAQELAELAKLAARRARPPSAGQEGTLPRASGKLDKLDRQDTDAQCRSNSAPSKRLGRSRSGLRQRQGLARASGKMGSCASLARFNGFGSAKSGFVQKIRAAWGTGECNGSPEEAEKPCRSSSKTESKKSCNSSARKPSNNWTVLSYLEDSWSLEMEGIWWEWQWWSPSGWSFFSSWVTEKIEKAFTMGKASCSLLHDGRPVEFDLHTGREVNGLGRIRRIRMPCDDTVGHGASVCSTFLATDRDGVSTMGENTMSLWTGVVGDSKVLREEPEASPGRTACRSPPQHVVHDTSIFGGFSSGWSADVSATHKPGRHGSRVKHRPAGVAPAVACISLKDINHTPLTSSDHVHHVWREEAYAALNRAGKLADPTH